MAEKQSDTSTKSQLDKFKEAAREHGADESEANWDESLKRVVKAPLAGAGRAKPKTS